jgi:NAD-dependent SIR2 family protein deacetylase
MDSQITDQNVDLMLDGNAVAGLLQEIFATELTIAPVQCANCGQEGEVGSLLAFTQGPGIVLRCPACERIVLRVVQTPQSIYLDARGAAYLCIPRPE